LEGDPLPGVAVQREKQAPPQETFAGMPAADYLFHKAGGKSRHE
jgi:hypothetical protein